MFKDNEEIEQKHKRFLKQAITNQEIWTLNNDEGYVSSVSNQFEDEDDEPLMLQVFWSDKKEANACSKEIWGDENFQLSSIALNEFIEYWCIGMLKDGVIVGTNFDYSLFGHEVPPLDLAKELLEKAKSAGLRLKFDNYDSVDEFLDIVNSHLE